MIAQTNFGRFGPLQYRDDGVALSYWLNPALRLEPGFRLSHQHTANNADLVNVPGRDQTLQLNAEVHTRHTMTTVGLAKREALTDFSAVRLAHMRRFESRLATTVEYGRNQYAPETAALRVGGLKDELRVNATYDISKREYLSISMASQRYMTQARTHAGDGTRIEAEIGYRIRTDYPNFTARLSGVHHALSSTASTDGRVIPESRERPSDWRGPRAWLMPQPKPAAAWLEIVVIMLIAVAIAWFADHQDPLHISSPFPWPWFAPVVIALRYGAVRGVVASLILLVAWYVLTPGSGSAALPKFHFLGGLLLVLVSAEFSSAWRLRLRRMFELNRYLEDRVERVTRRLYLLRLSHDRLEQELLSQPTTMRDAIVQLRERLANARGPGPLPGAQLMLQFLAQHCQLEAAALYTVSQDNNRRVERVARLGPAADLTAGDPLLIYVLERGELAHVQAEGVIENAATPQLLVAPITTSDARLLGVLSVSRMPFFALNQDTLQLIDVLLGAYADALAISPDRAAIRSVLPEMGDEFGEELARLMRIQRDFNIDSRMVVFTFGEHRYAHDAQSLLMRSRRAPDVAWSPVRAHLNSALVILLPITGAAAIEGYLLRTEAGLRETFGAGFLELRIRPVTIALSDANPVALLAHALEAPAPPPIDVKSPPPSSPHTA